MSTSARTAEWKKEKNRCGTRSKKPLTFQAWMDGKNEKKALTAIEKIAGQEELKEAAIYAPLVSMSLAAIKGAKPNRHAPRHMWEGSG